MQAEDVLFEVLRRPSTKKKSEEMLSNQMLSGIPEVDLGIEWVFCNILFIRTSANQCHIFNMHNQFLFI